MCNTTPNTILCMCRVKEREKGETVLVTCQIYLKCLLNISLFMERYFLILLISLTKYCKNVQFVFHFTYIFLPMSTFDVTYIN